MSYDLAHHIMVSVETVTMVCWHVLVHVMPCCHNFVATPLLIPAQRSKRSQQNSPRMLHVSTLQLNHVVCLPDARHDSRNA